MYLCLPRARENTRIVANPGSDMAKEINMCMYVVNLCGVMIHC